MVPETNEIYTERMRVVRETVKLTGLGFVGAVNTKVDMRFKVMEADWLPERIRLKLLQMVCCVLS
jgi:hypothetical protein